MTTITEGMTPAQFIAAVNANTTELAFTGKTVAIDAIMSGWKLMQTLRLDGANTLTHGMSGQSYITALNAISTSATIAGVTDVMTVGATGDGVTDDQAAVNAAVALGNIIIQGGTFLLSASIKIPSNRTVYLKNCIVKMANTSYDNVFRNSDFTNGNSNINIIGLGGVTIDMNAANNDDAFATYGTAGANTYKYISMMFFRVTGLRISGLHIKDYPLWCIAVCRCSTIDIHDILLEIVTVTQNQDGYDIFCSNNVEMYNLDGTTKDDYIGLFAFKSTGLVKPINELTFANYWIGDIYNLNIHDIEIDSTNLGSACALICGEGNKIYDIIYNGIDIISAGSLFYSNYGVWYTVAPALGDVHDFTIKNVSVQAITWGYVFQFGEDMVDFTATNINNRSGEPMYLLDGGDQTDNVTINGVQVV